VKLQVTSPDGGCLHQTGTHDKGAALRSRVKVNFQARFWNSGGRGDSPADCSKLSAPGWADNPGAHHNLRQSHTLGMCTVKPAFS
jgi:hypothetical protein